MFHTIIERLRHEVHKRRTVEHLFHISYCALVFIEGHGMYATAAGFLVVVLVMNFVLGE